MLHALLTSKPRYTLYIILLTYSVKSYLKNNNINPAVFIWTSWLRMWASERGNRKTKILFFHSCNIFSNVLLYAHAFQMLKDEYFYLLSVKKLNHLLLPSSDLMVVGLSHFDMHIRNWCKDQIVIQYFQIMGTVKQLYTSTTNNYMWKLGPIICIVIR